MKKSLYLLFTVFCCSRLFGQDCSIRLTGHVHSTISHENLPNATVQLSGTAKTLITNSNGDFAFDSLCAGTYSIIITHSSYDTIVKSVVVQRRLHVDFDLMPARNTLSKVTVTGVKGVQNTGLKRELSGRKLDETRGLSLAEALSKMNGVSVLQTGSTISKPIIHGLHSNRILTINNGVRQEGQQWGNEHSPEIDPFIANRLTIIKGVDELRYGSDAIGGVILVEPRALRNSPGYNAELNALYFANNRQYVTSFIFEQQLKKLSSFTYRLQGSFKKGANVNTPAYRLNNTGIEEKNFSLTAGWRKEHFNSEIYYSFFNTEIGIFAGSHIGNLSDLSNAIAASRPDPTFTGQNTYKIERPYQDVTHHLLKWKTGFDIDNNKFTVLVAGQHNQRKEYDVVRNSSTKTPQIDLSIFTFSEEINWEHPRKSNFSGVVGLTALQQDNSYSGRYLIPNYRSYSFGGYAIEKWEKGNLDVQAGVRYDNKDINTNRLQAASQTFTAYHFNFSTLASSVNAGFKILPEWKINSNVSLSTRAPQVNELLTNGIHHGAGTYEVGDIYLKPERSFNVSVNSSYTSTNKIFSADLTLYRNDIANFIYQQPKPDEPVLTIRGAFPKIVYEAADALLHGLDISTVFVPYQRFSLTSKYSMLRARNRRIDDWLIGMPADRIGNELTYNLKDLGQFSNTYFSIEVQNVFKQTRVPGDKNGAQDYKLPPEGYMLMNADVSTTIKLKKLPLAFSISGRNLLNKSYREYLNSFRYFTDEMGRNISIRLKIALEHFY
ncbi:MAG: TonB-dependent receptor [Chitinophagaceae bacterium]|nr:TonB-dependent receptor [Chitinophagaceae bacterium]